MTSRNGRRAKSPAFQAYPGDFLSDAKATVMSAEEVGCYWLLLCHCWIEGSLPDDAEFNARLARLSKVRFAKAWKLVGQCFEQREDGRLVNPRQERERKFQSENRARLLALSKKGVDARKHDTEEQSGAPHCDQEHAPSGAQDGDLPNPNTQRPNPESRIPTPDEKKKPPDKPAASRAKPTGQLADCIRHWEAEWSRTRLGTTCAIQAQDGVAVAWMLKQGDEHEVRRRMTAMLEDPDAWYSSNAALPLLRSKWNRYATTPRVNGQATPANSARAMFGLDGSAKQPRTVDVEARRA